MKKCPYCGYYNDEQAETCDRCKAMIPNETKEEPKGELRTRKNKKESE